MKKSPKILSSGWGKIEIENLGEFKDVKLWPGGGTAWDWREHGTGHSNGIQPAELNELIAAGCRHVVLTKGRLKRLHIPEITLKKLEQLGVKTYVLDTKKAIAVYNELIEKGEPAGGLFHTTC